MQSDDILTHQGMTQNGKGARILLLACGALAREILALIERNAWTHIDLKCLPAILHNAPEKITPLIREKVLEHQDHYDRIFVVYADCGTGGQLQMACDALGVEMMAGPHCYSFFEGNAEFAARDEFTAFYLTDFLVRQFDAFVRKPLGLDRYPDLRDTYFAHYTKLVYQSQIYDETLLKQAQGYADELGLAFEHRHTGFGDLENELNDQLCN